MTLQHIDTSRIDATDRLRQINPGWVEAFAREIEAGAVLAPVDVVKTADGYRLITGGHRLAAHVSLGRTTIEARIWPAAAFPDEGAMRLKEIQENILRFEPTELDRAVAILHWKRIFEETRPQPKRGRPSKEMLADSARIFAERFSTAAAKAMGISERSVQVSVQIATGLSDETRLRIAIAPIADIQSELLQLAAQHPDRQAKILDLLFTDPPAAGSVADAIAIIDRVPAPAAMAPWEKISDRFARLSEREQQRFFAAHEPAIERWMAARPRRRSA
ncbi:ParB N-terminal domain-containing protein [Prosthecomicrobium hirschii]|uniref:ParB N-terminal domain-containing protein n=1 Tax=Prosthecodimorpha hirschii TaxID=665126 RepID=UPI00221EDEAE|nr:ParB N-terminal domain-containing protein [Prosthecomicrobium hirschii]MCW1842265.1 ParB N-terminal domain-containing protein [Prosthecomicrobium hirschii]